MEKSMEKRKTMTMTMKNIMERGRKRKNIDGIDDDIDGYNNTGPGGNCDYSEWTLVLIERSHRCDCPAPRRAFFLFL